ncbi:glycosyltransferase family 2 protein [Paenibacillus sp. CFBP13512]|uniref:glycosyltransferase family 2 protein n=1 Tax=Paenibacillus sp. CFBP13512 TaxID=2184007 RepID=UPI0010C05313|nr:glycosyltransferase family 2 protein [Paenibacillus sp. CFBP13512]TKJ83446.1 glycosyltransferase family 2 protein [Paenibacillus sp. CFBP13512]
MINSTMQILLSTYNGGLYIIEQIESILNQKIDINILIRDDGSKDNTISILEDYVERYPEKIKVIYGKNVGVIASFWQLMKAADPQVNYFCFCDQDDVWMPDKANRALEQLKMIENTNESIPAMIFTATQLTDSELNPTAIWPSMPEKAPSFYNGLIQNIAVGATTAFNQQARVLLLDTHSPVDQSLILMHDWWMYITISCFGTIHFDPEPSIYYRQHGGNVVGGESTKLQKIKKKWNSFRKHKDQKLLVQQAKEFKRVYGDQITDPQMKQQLEAFIAPRSTLMQRIQYLRQCQLYRQSRTEQWLFRFLIIIGYI